MTRNAPVTPRASRGSMSIAAKIRKAPMRTKTMARTIKPKLPSVVKGLAPGVHRVKASDAEHDRFETEEETRAGEATVTTYYLRRKTYSGYETDQQKMPVEIFAQAPNQRTTIVHSPFGDSVRVYDGRAAWIASGDKPVPLMPLTAGNLAQVAGRMQHLLDALPALVANYVPADVVSAGVVRDVVGRRLQGKMRHSERDVSEKRLVVVLLVVFFQEVDRVIGDGGGGVVAFACFDGGQRLVVERVLFR